MPVILALRKWGQEDWEFEVNISYMRLSPATSFPKRKNRPSKKAERQKDAGLCEGMLPESWQKKG